ncbi:MAG TPA: UDP-N-acetylmuramoyl-tripeptide--D-alanyl-D-alanine ligase [Dehalococcoidia bacterium]|nr:UDP-N-acetylmuramoyl-tripeptide--D-alanyl-D-alanine ligase [Dehalococcoidia bacterium]
MFSIDEVREALGSALIGESQGVAESFSAVTNDSRVARAGELFVALSTENRDGHDFLPDAVVHGVAGAVVSRQDIFLPEGVWAFLVKDTEHALGDLALHWRVRLKAHCIAITGNVGKTTTKELTASLLARRFRVHKSPSNFNDNIGVAMSVLGLTEAHEIGVFETGMDHLGEIRRSCEIVRPHIAVVLNVGPTHLERLGSMEAIAQAKAEAVEALTEDGTAVLNADDPYVAAMAEKTRGRVLTFGLAPGATVRATEIRSHGLAGCVFTVSMGGRAVTTRSPLPGERLIANALAAVTVGISEGMSIEEAGEALTHAEVPLRLQARAGVNGATILDDSYNASPASVLAALGVLAEMPGRRLALLGDMLELGSAEADGHRAVGERAAEVTDGLFTVGPLGVQIAAAAKAAGSVHVRHFDSRDEAAQELKRLLEPGDILLVKASHGLALGEVVKELVT